MNIDIKAIIRKGRAVALIGYSHAGKYSRPAGEIMVGREVVLTLYFKYHGGKLNEYKYHQFEYSCGSSRSRKHINRPNLT